MESSLCFDTTNLGWSTVYIEGPEITGYIFPIKNIFPSLKIVLSQCNSADPDEMLHNATFHLMI